MARRMGDGSWAIEGLAADGPDPRLRKKLMLFGQFVGDWDILSCRYLQRNGKWSDGPGVVHWRWILGGRAVQDIWGSFDKRTGRTFPAGTTVRFYDGKVNAWRSVWLSPSQHRVVSFIGRKRGNEIVLDEQTEGRTRMKWTFYSIRKDSFRWRAEKSRDDGKTWKMYEVMRIRRQKPRTASVVRSTRRARPR